MGDCVPWEPIKQINQFMARFRMCNYICPTISSCANMLFPNHFF